MKLYLLRVYTELELWKENEGPHARLGATVPCLYPINHFIITTLRYFTILGQENAQNMTQYYTVERGEKYGRKAKQQNGRTKRPKRWLVYVLNSGLTYSLFDGLTCNTRGDFAHFSYFFSPLRGSGKYYATQTSNHWVKCIYYSTIAPFYHFTKWPNLYDFSNDCLLNSRFRRLFLIPRWELVLIYFAGRHLIFSSKQHKKWWVTVLVFVKMTIYLSGEVIFKWHFLMHAR